MNKEHMKKIAFAVLVAYGSSLGGVPVSRANLGIGSFTMIGEVANEYATASESKQNYGPLPIAESLDSEKLGAQFIRDLNLASQKISVFPEMRVQDSKIFLEIADATAELEIIDREKGHFQVNGEDFYFVPDMGFKYNLESISKLIRVPESTAWNPLDVLFPKAHALEMNTMLLIGVALLAVIALVVAWKAKSNGSSNSSRIDTLEDQSAKSRKGIGGLNKAVFSSSSSTTSHDD